MHLESNLAAILSPSRVHTRLIDRVAYANDASYFRLMPQAVVQPNSIGEIQSLFRFTQQHHIPMTFRAAGTSLSGQAVTDGILVDISKHWGAYRLEDDARRIRFQPGIIGAFLNNVLKPHRRRIGPDPASMDACMMGGILANNSSGMCCGVTENAYRTLHAMTFVLPNGFVLDTSAPNAHLIFENEQPEIAKGLLDLKRRILEAPASTGRDGESLAERIRRRYQMKNTNGYLLNAFLDFDAPLDILVHLLIGSEGTLGFIAEAALDTLPDFSYKYTGQLYFQTTQDAAAAIFPLRKAGVRAAEIMDRASLRSVENLPGAPSLVAQLPETAAAILVEYQAGDLESISRFRKEAQRVVKELRLIHDAEFTDDPTRQAALWKLRKGIIPSVGAMRPPATTLLTEDVVFPVPRLADGVNDLQALFDHHGYREAVIFGHAKDGNLHFLIAQSFSAEDEIKRFANFTSDLVRLVSGKYDGALKAEHGTGRNMTPFVETEWGAEAYAVMRDLKSLLDPDHMLNPNVVIDANPQGHITHLKHMAVVAPNVDKCIECGFCESKCPSRTLTLSPRQRIVVRREIARLTSLASDSPERAALLRDYSYDGLDTCAVDGLCATACPVNINTGDLTKRLRAEAIQDESTALWLANHFAFTERALGWGIRLGRAAEKVIGVTGVNAVITGAEKVTKTILPKWNRHISAPAAFERGGKGDAQFVYFPSCISRQMGKPVNGGLSLAETFLLTCQRASVTVCIPEDVNGVCCGMPFNSKGYTKAYRAVIHKTILQFWEWSRHGQAPIVIDTTSCVHSLRSNLDLLTPEEKELWQKMTVLDGIEFLHDFVLPKLSLHPVDEAVVLHPNCSAQKLGLQEKLLTIAKKCAHKAAIPLHLGCCAFAGDRGLLFPELTKSATQKEAAEVNAGAYGGYYSSNLTCEMGMSEATGKDYVSIVHLVEKASR